MTGLRIDTKRLNRLIEEKKRVRADEFRAELQRFAKRTLESAMKATPVRAASVIRDNQKRQYHNRVSYIPSVHTIEDPTLIVKPDAHWLYAGGKWYAATYRHIPDDIQAIYDQLLTEHFRRLATPEGAFITERMQARYLYRKSWWQVAQSLGIEVKGGPQITTAHSRHNPRKEPPRAFGQWHGGKDVLSISVQNKFLEIESRYKPFSGKAILAGAINLHQARFLSDVEKKLNKLVAA